MTGVPPSSAGSAHGEAQGGWPPRWRAWSRYLPWRSRPRAGGGVGKVPHALVGGRWRPVDPLNDTYWLDFAEARGEVARGQADGIGLTLTPDLGLVALDLDGCLNCGRLTDAAAAVLTHFPGAFAERSSSGSGLHVLLRATCPPGWRRQGDVEIINRGFLTVAGQPWGGAATLPDHTAALAAWHAERTPARKESRQALPGSVALGDAALLATARSARNATRFEALWAGEATSAASPSEGDLALLLLLRYWGGPGTDDDQLDRLFRASGRMRPKWADVGGLTPYARRTLQAARRIAGQRG